MYAGLLEQTALGIINPKPPNQFCRLITEILLQERVTTLVSQ
jgi:hypothetical protein